MLENLIQVSELWIFEVSSPFEAAHVEKHQNVHINNEEIVSWQTNVVKNIQRLQSIVCFNDCKINWSCLFKFLLSSSMYLTFYLELYLNLLSTNQYVGSQHSELHSAKSPLRLQEIQILNLLEGTKMLCHILVYAKLTLFFCVILLCHIHTFLSMPIALMTVNASFGNGAFFMKLGSRRDWDRTSLFEIKPCLDVKMEVMKLRF